MSIYTTRKTTMAIVVHCSATRASQDIGLKEVREWHRNRGFVDVGYHAIIRRDASLELGRPIWTVGAHVEGFNHDTIGVCLVGGLDPKGKPENNFSEAQFETLEHFICDAMAKYSTITDVKGHRDYSKDRNGNGKIDSFERLKECPCFDAIPWWAERRMASAATPATFTVTKDSGTYWTISRKTGVNVFALMEANEDKPPYALKVGDVLRLP